MKNGQLLRVKRQMMIHTVVQFFLIALLFFMAWYFQGVFAVKGEPQVFINSIIVTSVLQVALFYPLYRFAGKEARNEIIAQTSSDPDEVQLLRKRRIAGDYLKAAVFIFYVTFISLSPPVTFVLCTTFFSFIATTVTYLQSFNYCARKIMKTELALVV